MTPSITCKLGTALFLTLATTWSATLWAAPTDSEKAAAAALFKEARTLVDQGNDAAGCPKFEQALALYPSTSTLLNLAKCHERAGKWATAWRDYQSAAVLTAQEEDPGRREALEKVAKQGVEAVAPKVPKLQLTVGPLVPDMRVTVGGNLVAVASLGTPLLLDPGEYHVRVEAPGFVAQEQVVRLAEGSSESRTMTLVKDAPPQAVTLQPSPTVTSPQPVYAPQPAVPAHEASTERADGALPVWAIASGALGLAALGGAAFFAYDYSKVRADVSDACPNNVCTRATVDEASLTDMQARWNRDVGLMVGLGAVGAAGVGLFGYSFLTRPENGARVQTGITVGPDGASATFQGAF